MLRHSRHAFSLWQILPDQAVGVFIGSPLPGRTGMREVDLHFHLRGKEPVLAHFLALVIGERATQLHQGDRMNDPTLPLSIYDRK